MAWRRRRKKNAALVSSPARLRSAPFSAPLSVFCPSLCRLASFSARSRPVSPRWLPLPYSLSPCAASCSSLRLSPPCLLPVPLPRRFSLPPRAVTALILPFSFLHSRPFALHILPLLFPRLPSRLPPSRTTAILLSLPFPSPPCSPYNSPLSSVGAFSTFLVDFYYFHVISICWNFLRTQAASRHFRPFARFPPFGRNISILLTFLDFFSYIRPDSRLTPPFFPLGSGVFYHPVDFIRPFSAPFSPLFARSRAPPPPQ